MDPEGTVLRDVLEALTTNQLREELERRSKDFEGLRPDSPAEALFATGPGTSAAHAAFRIPPPLIDTPPQEVDPPRLARHRASATDLYHMMRRWNVEFSGSRGSDAEAFLTRIKEGRELITVTDDELFRCIPFFLSGIALYWYRNERNRWNNWPTFEAAWRARFGNPDFQFALRDEVMRRTQGEHEPIADFLTCIRALFDRLDPPWTLHEQLNYAHRNMLPRLQIAVHRRDFFDFASLESLARVEISYDAVAHYRAPPPAEKSIFPDLAYRPPRKINKPLVSVSAAGIAVSTPKAPK